MELTEWLGIAALTVAVIVVPVSVWATRQWGNRRANLEISVVATPLLPEDADPGALEVTYHDIPVTDPHLVTVKFRNTGPRDLTTGTFDGGRPITVAFDQMFYGLTKVEGGIKTVSPAIGTEGSRAVVDVEPNLLKRGDVWSFSAVTTGPVRVSLDAPLIDTDIRQAADADERPEVTLGVSMFGISAEIPLRRSANR